MTSSIITFLPESELCNTDVPQHNSRYYLNLIYAVILSPPQIQVCITILLHYSILWSAFPTPEKISLSIIILVCFSHSRENFFVDNYPTYRNIFIHQYLSRTEIIILYDGNGSVQSLEIEEVLISNKISFFIISSRIELIVFSGISQLSKYLRGKSKWAMA